jgi:hypothetical protein
VNKTHTGFLPLQVNSKSKEGGEKPPSSFFGFKMGSEVRICASVNN